MHVDIASSRSMVSDAGFTDGGALVAVRCRWWEPSRSGRGDRRPSGRMRRRTRPARLLAASAGLVAGWVVAWSPATAATLSDAGTAPVVGVLTYSSATVPMCPDTWGRPFSLSLNGIAADVVLPGSEYTGPVAIAGSGAYFVSCFWVTGDPSFSIAVTGSGPIGQMACSVSVVAVAYGSAWVWNGQGSCTVAEQSVPNVSLYGITETAVPTGVTASGAVTSMAMSGVLRICAPSGSTGC